MKEGTSSAPLGHLLPEGVEKGQILKAVPSPSQMEKVPQRGG